MKYTLFLCILLLTSCSDAAIQQELEAVKADLATAQSSITSLRNQIEPEGNLVHIVLFKLKPDVNQAAILAEAKKLENIKEVMDLEIGPFENLGDARALLEYTMVMQMSFADATSYQIYQQHPIHLALKENVKQYLSGPPATYDFMKK